ncbi:hypothetical protein AVEN_34384-1 [Araneus ventricosus]|uniref:Uncharacterized protein n=1 Tax=Araneus ventricosus TaxID=182803 RepID=A0A4Y2G613_ARAVE|nr:hypothetical protein AVEN_34384-1 [Araneus ventricosus]
MPRNYIKKTSDPKHTKDDLKKAVLEVKKGSKIYAAKKFSVKEETVRRWVVKSPSHQGQGISSYLTNEEEMCIVCWSDEKGDVKKRNNIFKAANLKTGRGRNEEKPLSPLEERILQLIGLDAADGLGMPDSESVSEVHFIPRVDENKDSPTSGNVSNEFSTELYTNQPYTQKFNKTDFVEYLLPDTGDCVVNNEELHLFLCQEPRRKRTPQRCQSSVFKEAGAKQTSIYEERKCSETVRKLDLKSRSELFEPRHF